MSCDAQHRGLTVPEVMARLRVGSRKVHGWIERGLLQATNTSDLPGRPRWVVSPEALAAFQAGRGAVTPPAKPTRRYRRPRDVKDYYPD
jgi:hypothetical protein